MTIEVKILGLNISLVIYMFILLFNECWKAKCHFLNVHFLAMRHGKHGAGFM